MSAGSVDQPHFAVQKAIFERLTGDVPLMSDITGVYDGTAPEGVAYPYVIIGETISTPDNAHGFFGRSIVTTLHVWSKARGHGQGLGIEGHIIRLLDHQPLEVPGHTVVSVRYEFSQTLIDPAPPGDIRHIPIRFRITTGQE